MIWAPSLFFLGGSCLFFILLHDALLLLPWENGSQFRKWLPKIHKDEFALHNIQFKVRFVLFFSSNVLWLILKVVKIVVCCTNQLKIIAPHRYKCIKYIFVKICKNYVIFEIRFITHWKEHITCLSMLYCHI